MKEYVSESEFIDRFRVLDRKENFSYDGRKALFEYFEQLEDDMGEEIEFDCIAICCEYSEFEDLTEFNENYDLDCKSLDDVREHTEVIEIDGTDSFIVRCF